MRVYQIIKQILYIVIISILVSVGLNFIHPHKVVFSFSRPQAEYAADSTLDEIENNQANNLDYVVINRGQLQKLVEQRGAIVLDARIPDEYNAGHIPGAVNIPAELLGEYYQTINEYSRQNWIIIYCDGPPCDLSEMLGMALKSDGFERVALYYDGLDDWKKAGFAIEKGM